MLVVQKIQNLCIVLLITLIFIVPIHAQFEHEAISSVTVAWTPPPDAEWHEMKIHFLQGDMDINYSILMPTAEQIILRPRSGKFEVHVRACKAYTGGNAYSEWVNSAIEGIPEPWIIFWKPGSVFGVIIEDF